VSFGLNLSTTARGGRWQGPQRHSSGDTTRHGLRPDIMHDTETRTQAERELKLTSTKIKASRIALIDTTGCQPISLAKHRCYPLSSRANDKTQGHLTGKHMGANTSSSLERQFTNTAPKDKLAVHSNCLKPFFEGEAASHPACNLNQSWVRT
jgi:hypothetical protein